MSRIESDWEITEHEPGKRIVLKVTPGPALGTVAFDFAPAGGADFRCDMNFSFKAGPQALMFWLMGPMVRRQMRKDFGKMKGLVEGGAG